VGYSNDLYYLLKTSAIWTGEATYASILNSVSAGQAKAYGNTSVAD
jgi:hypothetical protein